MTFSKKNSHKINEIKMKMTLEVTQFVHVKLHESPRSQKVPTMYL